jgi:hypothetical protein
MVLGQCVHTPLSAEWMYWRGNRAATAAGIEQTDSMGTSSTTILAGVIASVLLITGVAVFLYFPEWRRRTRMAMNREAEEIRLARDRIERDERHRQEDREAEEKIREEERQRQETREWREEKRREEEAFRQAAGPGNGGYIVIDLPHEKRPFFHDLLKGFEEYARLKGYSVSFSIDATHKDKVAFKFTVDNDVINVGPLRVRKDFQEYVERVQAGDDLSDMPVITSVEEHNLLVTILRNRISFLQHSYNLEKNAVEFYAQVLRNLPAGAIIPGPSVVVQAGGQMDSRRYISTGSQKLIQGDGNTYTDNSIDASIRIGASFNERRTQIDLLGRLIAGLNTDGPDSHEKQGVIQDIGRVKDELEDQERPDGSRIKVWLERAKTGLQALSVGKETLELVNAVLKSFGISALHGA